jgi:tRNA A-37 threonylcarbamoyl transferase component Bud32
MGVIDRWLKRFTEKVTDDDSARESVDPQLAPPTSFDPLDEVLRDARGRLTTDDRGRRYAEGADLQNDVRTLDDGGRARAGDHLLADALLVTRSPTLRRQLAERLLYRGRRDEARPLLEGLADVTGHEVFALTALAEHADARGDGDQALELYERVLAVDITLAQQKARARRLRTARESREKQDGQGHERSALTRFLGARAAGARYAVLDEIGRGGAATVFRARDRAVSREVALKIFHPRGRADERRARILREARIAGAFDHPHVVPILDVDAERDLLVMHICDGGSLRQRISRGRVPVLEAAEIGSILLRTLADVHDAGKVHLDIKPSNLLFHGDRLMLCDFGTAGLAELGAAAGTRAYMAPEQRTRGKPRAKADLYAAGLVIAETITGTLPKGAAMGQPTIELDVLPRGPARRALEAVISHMCALDPDDRPSNGRLAAARLLEAAALPVDDKGGGALYAHLEALAAREGERARERLQSHPTIAALRPPT